MRTFQSPQGRWARYNADPANHARRRAAVDAARIAGPAPAYPTTAPIFGDWIGYLLVQSTGMRYRYGGVRSAWVRALARAGIEDLNIHDLRGRAGADVTEERGPYEAQKLLGHASVTMTEGYTRGKTRRRARAAK